MRQRWQGRKGGATGDRHGARVSVRVTGVGKSRNVAGVKAMLDQSCKPDSILALGFAGALTEELETGDFVLARRFYATGEDTFIEADALLLALAQEALKDPDAPRYTIADNLTVPKVVVSAAGKGRLADSTTTWVANMEDYWTAKVATERGIPFLSARVVLDTLHQELPRFGEGIGNKGTLGQLLHVAASLIARPQDLSKVVALSRQVKVARESLAVFAMSFVGKVTAGGSYAPL